MQSPIDPATAEEAVMLAMVSLGRRMRHRAPGDQIDLSVWPVLKTLVHNGPMRLSTLAAELGLDASTVSRHVRQLEGRGLLQRTDDPDDGRASRVAVSEHGSACLEEGAQARRAVIAAVLDQWDDQDRDQLRVLLARFYNDLNAPQHSLENS
jgi:DNA-binding MarR family transcriptional regulator